MKNLLSKWNHLGLITRIIIGLVIGAILGIACPKATAIVILGDMFVGALRAIAPVLVFVLVMSSLANSKGNAANNMKTVIILYMITTLIGAVVAAVGSFIFPQTLILTEAATEVTPPSGIGEVLKNLLLNIVSNPIAALVDANYIGILTWAVILGAALKCASDTSKKFLQDISDAVTQAVHWIISCAPFGILGLVFNTVSTNGLSIFTSYGKLLALLVGCMLFTVFVTNPSVVFFCLRKNPYPLVFKCLKESGITAFFTRSSAANIPMNMALCERLGLNKDNYSVSIPLGATINMDGAAITITVMTLATANTLGITVDLPTAVILSVLATTSACGASGVAGGSLLLIPLACSLFGISNDIAMQTVGVGFIIGVIQDSVETALNSSSDVVMTATAELYQRRKAGEDIVLIPKN
ncbi:MAG: serine/threonine transporter SstT [Lachnospiraceae bacterium]|nr:serine/threonine transporter SstT [Lachnospiraceae bacterium]